MTPDQESKRRRIRNVLVGLAATLIIVYILKGIALYTFQRHFLYFPPDRPAVTTDKDITVAEPVTADGLHLKAWFAPPKGNKPVVAYFHGNGDDISIAPLVMPYFLKHGYGMIMCEYRGYSQLPGEPTEQGLYADARACLDWLKQKGYGIDKVVFYAHSLGTGVAVQLATEFQPKILILESAFTSIMDMARPHYPLYPIDIMARDRFDSLSKIAQVHANLLMVHGFKDDLVPFDLGRRLFGAANQPKTFIAIYDGGHNDLYLHGVGDNVVDWLDKQVAGEKDK